MKQNQETEAVETCPYCVGENTYPDKDCEQEGYIETCQHCGKEIFLCDECKHADDNIQGSCGWHEEVKNGQKFGVCFRGIVRLDKD